MTHCVRYLFVTVGMFVAGAAHGQDFKSQVTTGAANWDAAFNAGDASKSRHSTRKDAVIMPAGGNPVTGHDGVQTLCGGIIKSGVKAHKVTVESAEADGNLGYAYGTWQADRAARRLLDMSPKFQENESGWHLVLHTWTRKPST